MVYRQLGRTLLGVELANGGLTCCVPLCAQNTCPLTSAPFGSHTEKEAPPGPLQPHRVLHTPLPRQSSWSGERTRVAALQAPGTEDRGKQRKTCSGGPILCCPSLAGIESKKSWEERASFSVCENLQKDFGGRAVGVCSQQVGCPRFLLPSPGEPVHESHGLLPDLVHLCQLGSIFCL